MKVFLLSFLTLLAASCLKQKTEGVLVVNSSIFEQKMAEEGIQLVDARTPEEFKEKHIANALNVNILGEDFEEKVVALDKNKPVLVYCKSGVRSANAAAKLKAMGFTTIIDLDGGITQWISDGKPVEN
jgi:rhodanese-related sulfurtransferase